MRKIEKERILHELVHILRKACHAPDCDGLLRTCPNQCGCNKRRKFKLNTETAMCWVIANEIGRRLRHSKITITQQDVDIAYAYIQLSNYHMSQGWKNLLLSVHRILRIISDGKRTLGHVPGYDYIDACNRELSSIRYSVNRLKREPR